MNVIFTLFFVPILRVLSEKNGIGTALANKIYRCVFLPICLFSAVYGVAFDNVTHPSPIHLLPLLFFGDVTALAIFFGNVTSSIFFDNVSFRQCDIFGFGRCDRLPLGRPPTAIFELGTARQQFSSLGRAQTEIFELWTGPDGDFQAWDSH